MDFSHHQVWLLELLGALERMGPQWAMISNDGKTVVWEGPAADDARQSLAYALGIVRGQLFNTGMNSSDINEYDKSLIEEP